MEKLVLEVQTRSLNHYHHLNKFPVSVGRALDNDIILSDATISAHHLILDRDEKGDVIVTNLSSENGTRVNGKTLAVDAQQTVTAPARLRIAHRRTRLLQADMPVAQTTLSVCRGLFSVFCHPLGVLILSMLAILAMSFKNTIDSPAALDVLGGLAGVIPAVFALFLISFAVAGITRLTTNRWEIAPAIGMASLFILIPHLLLEAGHWSAYFLTAEWPMDLVLLINKFILLPSLLFIYIKRMYHNKPFYALGVSLLLSSPLWLYQGSAMIEESAQDDMYVNDIKFSRTLSSLDMRLENTKSQEAFLEDVAKKLIPAPDSEN